MIHSSHSLKTKAMKELICDAEWLIGLDFFILSNTLLRLTSLTCSRNKIDQFDNHRAFKEK